MSFIIAQEEAKLIEQVGGKAAALHTLDEFGFNPPDFFVISSDAFQMTDSGAFAKRGLKTQITNSLKSLGKGPFAVRSSARQEDGIEHSHAGQFDTYLNVPASKVFEAAQNVWHSGFNETVEKYRQLKSGGEREAPSIIVQKMVDAKLSGVAFSADPVSGNRSHVVISAIEGLGERLVSGEADGEDWIINHDGSIFSKPAPTKALTPKQAKQIADLAIKVESKFGTPQDIEWAIDNDALHILQARPITTSLAAKANDDQQLTIFDNSNIIESYPGLVSPLTYSFAQHVYSRVYRAFVKLLGVRNETISTNAAVFDNMLSRVDGRVYYNLVNWYRALALLPGFSLNRSYMETMMGVSEPLPKEVTENIGPPPAKGIFKALEYLKLGAVGLGLLWHAVWLPITRKRFYNRLNKALSSDLDLSKAGSSQLAAEYRIVENTLLDKWDAPLINDFLCMIAFGASRKKLEKWLGDTGLEVHNDVMIGQGDIISAEPAQRIAKMGQMVKAAGIKDAIINDGMRALDGHPEILNEVNSYIEKFGDRCTEELKLESIPLSEDPTTLLFAIAASAGRDTHNNHVSSDPDWTALFPQDPFKRAIASWMVSWAKARVRDRENLRFERTRVFGYARQIFLAIGREFAAKDLIASQRDVFFLTKNEVLGAIEGFGLSPDLKSIIEMRKSADVDSQTRNDPPERIEVRGPAIAIASSWEADTHDIQDNDKIKFGTACSAGQVVAKARVIRDPRSEKLEPGDILVARHTDPGWIAVFSNASAIVVERGSLLSHSAIVARELGIPCIVGLKGATNWIKDGETLKVNGATGQVEKRDG